MRETVLQLVSARAGAFERLPTAVRDVLRLCDGTRTLSGVVALSPLPAATTRRVVERLLELGLVTERALPPSRGRSLAPRSLAWARDRPGAPELAFSADEEAFFGRGIDHLVGDEIYED